VNGALAPDRQPVWLGPVKPRKSHYIIGMLLRVERADHVSPFSRPRDGDRATARAIGQALDRHDLDVLLAGFEALQQDLHQTRAGAHLLILNPLVKQAAGDADKQL
jgi:hypothetical protein